jgi:phosphoglycolate phosphatase
MIGDSIHDARMAKAARVAMIGVCWGFQPADWLTAEGAVAILDRFEALHDHLPGQGSEKVVSAIAG